MADAGTGSSTGSSTGTGSGTGSSSGAISISRSVSGTPISLTTNGRKRVGRTSAARRAAAKSSRQPCHPNGTMRLQRGVVRVVGGSMCRWLAYSGSPVLLEELLYGPENSLIVQSLHSRMGAEETNGDGFGVGWHGDRGAPAGGG